MGIDVAAERESKARHPNRTPAKVPLDCSACKTDRSMAATHTARFGGGLRFIGYLIAIPSTLGSIISILTVYSAFQEMNQVSAMNAEPGVVVGAALGGGIGITMGLAMAAAAIIGGTVGFLLLKYKEGIQVRQLRLYS